MERVKPSLSFCVNPKLKTYWSTSFLQLENHYEIGEIFKCKVKKEKKKSQYQEFRKNLKHDCSHEGPTKSSIGGIGNPLLPSF
jgi:hypothetical protein